MSVTRKNHEGLYPSPKNHDSNTQNYRSLLLKPHKQDAAQKLLSLSLPAITAGLSLQHSLASNIIHNLTRSSDSISAKGPVVLRIRLLKYNANATKEIIGEIEKFHTDHFVDSRFTTDTLYPEGKAVVEFLCESLQPVVALNSNIEFFHRLRGWKGKNSAAVGSLARVREFIVGNSKELATVVTRYGVDFTKGLSAFLRKCHKGRSSSWY